MLCAGRKPVPGGRAPARASGFTLIELIVVILIIGIIVSFASLSINQHGDQRLKTEAQRLEHLVKLASDEAIMQTREYAIRFTPEGYSFLVLGSEGKFMPIEGDPMFSTRKLDEDTKLALVIEGEDVKFDPEVEPPNIYILSSGEVTPTFKVSLSDKEELLGQFDIEVNFAADVKVTSSGQDDQE